MELFDILVPLWALHPLHRYNIHKLSNSLSYDQTVHFTCDFIPRHHKTVGFLYPRCQQFLKDKSLSQLVKHYFLCTVAMNTFLCNKTHHIQDQVSMFDKHSLALNMSDRLLSF